MYSIYWTDRQFISIEIFKYDWTLLTVNLLLQVLQSEVKELRERTRDLESRQRRTQAERDAARGRADQLAEQLGAVCSCRGGRRLPPAPGGWAEKNSDEDSGKHSDNSLSQSEPGWLLDSAARYKVQYISTLYLLS